MRLRVPDVVANANAAAACGADWWLRDHPRLVADLEAEAECPECTECKA
jgi:hypothetical protein